MTTKNEKQEQPEAEIVTLPTKENAMVEIIPFGTTDRIRLSAAIVRQMIAQPTRSGKQPDDNQCIKFMMLCKARHLNPFEGDAYMLGYDTQSGPQFSLITAHQVFLKRAEASKGFNGMESGVIVRPPDHDGKIGGGPILEREGDLVYDDEKLIGGWAKVYRKDREKPFYRRLKLATFNTGRSRWEKDPAGMIVKCAEADSLRTAFPTHLGGLYVQEETPPIDVTAGDLPIKRAKFRTLKDHAGIPDPINDGTQQATSEEQGSGTTPGESVASDVSGVSTLGDTQPTGTSNEAPSAPPPKRRLKKAKAEPQTGPNEQKMLMRLEGLKRTTANLIEVLVSLGGLKEGDTWADIGGEGDFEDLLHVDNWRVIEEALKK